MLTIDDVDDCRCGPGWRSILQRMVDELNAAHLDVHALVAQEHQGRLRIDCNYDPARVPFVDVARIRLLAECRAYYICEMCGAPGEHRANAIGWRATRCAEHQTADMRSGRVVYDAVRTPWRQMSDGRWRYDPGSDVLLHVSSDVSEYNRYDMKVLDGMKPFRARPTGFITPDDED